MAPTYNSNTTDLSMSGLPTHNYPRYKHSNRYYPKNKYRNRMGRLPKRQTLDCGNGECAKRIHNPNRRNSGSTIRAGAVTMNTVSSSHRNSCDRLRRWFQTSFDHRHSCNCGTHCWCRWRRFRSPAPMCGCRSPGRCRNRKRQRRGSCRCMFQDTERSGRNYIRCNLRGRAKNARLPRRCPETRICRRTGSCR